MDDGGKRGRNESTRSFCGTRENSFIFSYTFSVQIFPKVSIEKAHAKRCLSDKIHCTLPYSFYCLLYSISGVRFEQSVWKGWDKVQNNPINRKGYYWKGWAISEILGPCSSLSRFAKNSFSPPFQFHFNRCVRKLCNIILKNEF